MNNLMLGGGFLTSHWGQMLIIWALTYFVYWDSTRKKVPYSNLWIIGTFVLPPVFVAYLLYRFTAAKKLKPTLKQQEEAALRQQTVEAQANLKREKAAWEAAKVREEAENKLTEKELEDMRKARLEAKARRMEELAEERRLQEEENAKALHLK